VEGAQHGTGIELADSFTLGKESGIVDQQIQTIDLRRYDLGSGIDGGIVRHIQREHRKLVGVSSGKFGKISCLSRLAACGENPFAALEVLLGHR